MPRVRPSSHRARRDRRATRPRPRTRAEWVPSHNAPRQAWPSGRRTPSTRRGATGPDRAPDSARPGRPPARPWPRCRATFRREGDPVAAEPERDESGRQEKRQRQRRVLDPEIPVGDKSFQRHLPRVLAVGVRIFKRARPQLDQRHRHREQGLLRATWRRSPFSPAALRTCTRPPGSPSSRRDLPRARHIVALIRRRSDFPSRSRLAFRKTR